MAQRRAARHRISGTNDSNLIAGIYSPGKRNLITTSPESLSVGKRLRRERYLRKLTLEQMSQFLGISPSYLGAMERGDRPISRKMMDLLHGKLDLSYDFMLEGISITGSAITQYVKESSDYSVHHNLDVLLKVCNEEELESCYQLVHTYLSHKRDYRAKHPLKDKDAEI